MKEITKKVVEAIDEEIREPRWEGRVKFVEFYPLAEIDDVEIDLYMDENGSVNITLWKDNGTSSVLFIHRCNHVLKPCKITITITWASPKISSISVI